MWENKNVKGQRQKKCKVDPQLELKSQAAKKIDLTIEEVAKHDVVFVESHARH